jgi:large subunit ribosomal protein L17
MRHGKKFNHLSRTSAHRKSMLANMACSLIKHKRIKTTLAKAKALRVYVEPLITKSKDDTTHSRRTVFSYLKQKEAITELFSDISTKVANRPGGYTRILKLSNRLGDNAQMAYVELVDYNEDYTTVKPARKKARRAKKKIVDSDSSVIEEAVVIEKNVEKLEDIVSVGEALVEEVKSEDTVSEEETPVEEVKSEDTVSEEETPVEEVKSEDTVSEEETPVEEGIKKDDSKVVIDSRIQQI